MTQQTCVCVPTEMKNKCNRSTDLSGL